MTSPEPDQAPQVSFFEAVGGHETFRTLVRNFYTGVAEDDVLRPLYPEDDLEPATERLTLFLEQYWGGPTTYSDNRGHPRLRMRHAPFAVDSQARDRWLLHMRAAVTSLQLPRRTSRCCGTTSSGPPGAWSTPPADPRTLPP